jgi:ergothioneine biosynthesis protein EgtB
MGHQGNGFGFDNEFPHHPVYLEPFALRDELVTCGEWMEFLDDGGYHRPDLWLSDGWATIQAECWDAPLYWWRADGEWQEFTLGGPTPVDPGRPVCHVSYYEADAFARWAGARLPTEAEWEVATQRMTDDADGANNGSGANDGARSAPVTPHLLDQEVLRPLAPEPGRRPSLLGDVWQWTSSAYGPYPGFAPAPGAVGEYNGKFMVNQYVLRGGSCATPPGHVRTTYRNFFPPAARWPFTGLRIARSA